MPSRPQTRLLTVLLPLFAAAHTSAQATSPAGRGQLEGNSFTHYPLGRANARMQTLHDDIPGGTVIGGHAYRRDAIGVRGLVPGFVCDLQVTLSISPNLAANASTTFANNVGPNPVVVLPRTLVNFPSTDRPQLDPAPTFDLIVPYATPFVMPPQGGTLCVDIEVFGNQSAAGIDQNLSIYLDSHLHHADGRAEQPAFRAGNGCPAPGQTQDCYADLDLWQLPNGTSELDLSLRNGVSDSGNGQTRAFLTLGTDLTLGPWPMRSDCTFWSSAELWFALPGTTTSTGSYDGLLTGLPLLPAGFRLWCQAGSIDLSTVGMAFSDALTLVTPPLGPLPIPTVRVANANNQAAPTGTISDAVPVMQFF